MTSNYRMQMVKVSAIVHCCLLNFCRKVTHPSEWFGKGELEELTVALSHENGWLQNAAVDVEAMPEERLESAINERATRHVEYKKREASWMLKLKFGDNTVILTPSDLLREFEELYVAKGEVVKPQYLAHDYYRRFWVIPYANAVRRKLQLPLITEVPARIHKGLTEIDRIEINGMENFMRDVGAKNPSFTDQLRWCKLRWDNRENGEKRGPRTLFESFGIKTGMAQKFGEIILADSAHPSLMLYDKAVATDEFLAKLNKEDMRKIRDEKGNTEAEWQAYFADPTAGKDQKSKSASGKVIEEEKNGTKAFIIRRVYEGVLNNDLKSVRAIDQAHYRAFNIATQAILNGLPDHPVYAAIVAEMARQDEEAKAAVAGK